VFPKRSRVMQAGRMKMPLIVYVLALTLCLCSSYSAKGRPFLKGSAQPRQDRTEMLETLLGGKNPAARIQAAKSLVSHIEEPGVRSAFIECARDGNSRSLRAIAVEALANAFYSDDEVQHLLIGLLQDSDSGVRLAVAESLGKHVDNPSILVLWMKVLKNEGDLALRVRLIKDLGTQIDRSEVYDFMLDVNQNDSDVIGRAYALDALAPKIRERPELRELFLNGLDNEAYFYQLHALKGLVELQDPALKDRLLKMAVYLVARGTKEKWFNELVDEAVAQLRTLDPQAAETVINNLKRADR
jgi:hypothetical protein